MIDLILKIKAWFYVIPVVAFLRHVFYQIRDWNRAVGYLINWFVMHPAGAYLLASPGLLIGALVTLRTHNAGHVWLCGLIAALVVWVAYLTIELAGWKKAPWWDHVGDMLGPSWVAVHMLLLFLKHGG